MIDTIELSSPFGPLGRAVDRVVLERYLARLIGARNDHGKAAAENAPPAS